MLSERQRAARARRAPKPTENGLVAASSSKSSSGSFATLTAIRRASSFVSSLAADRPGVHELIADVSFQPQQPVCDKVEEDSADNHHADHRQPK
jgi:hypothetical protein